MENVSDVTQIPLLPGGWEGAWRAPRALTSTTTISIKYKTSFQTPDRLPMPPNCTHTRLSFKSYTRASQLATLTTSQALHSHRHCSFATLDTMAATGSPAKVLVLYYSMYGHVKQVRAVLCLREALHVECDAGASYVSGHV